ncbi:MAG: GatB/YqeY domain-containing protein [Saccharofermentans sp.]|nr:GatB/YqeY domain-containing protein [Saccharofermentans sp.]
MQLKELQQAMIAAMKAKDKERKDAISTLYGAAKQLGIDKGCREEIPEDLVNQAILGELKAIKEQIDTCPKDRTELLEQFNFKKSVIEEFAPKMLSGEEIEKVIKEKFADLLLDGNKGSIMKAVMGELKGKADGKLINEIVGKLTK